MSIILSKFKDSDFDQVEVTIFLEESIEIVY